MTVGILLVSHAPLGQTLLDTAINNLSICPSDTDECKVLQIYPGKASSANNGGATVKNDDTAVSAHLGRALRTSREEVIHGVAPIGNGPIIPDETRLDLYSRPGSTSPVPSRGTGVAVADPLPTHCIHQCHLGGALTTAVLDIPFGIDPDTQAQQAEALYTHLDTGNGVLVLTDLCGATPGNIASRLAHHPHVMVIAGLNLPMLMRVLNYPTLELAEMAEHAAEGGRRGILSLPNNCKG